LQVFSFAPGRVTSHVFFNTGNNDSVQLVISATPDRPVDVIIRWLKPRLILEQVRCDLPIRLPAGPEWATCIPNLLVNRHPEHMSLSWRGEGGPYLLKSNKIRCSPDSAAEARVLLEVQEGRIGVGVLDSAGSTWLTTKTLDAGSHLFDLQFDTKANDAVSFVLFAVPGAPLIGSISFSENAPKESALTSPQPDRSFAAIYAAAGATQWNNANTTAAIAASLPTRALAELASLQGADAGHRPTS
jgi:hypothetical protein